MPHITHKAPWHDLGFRRRIKFHQDPITIAVVTVARSVAVPANHESQGLA